MAPSAAQWATIATRADKLGNVLDVEGVWGATSTVSGARVPNLETLIKETRAP